MILSIFSPLYEVFIGQNSDFPEYRASLFASVGFITFLMAIVFCLVFYVALGRFKPIWHKLIHWIITIVIVAIVAFIFAYTQTKGQLGVFDSYGVRFSLFNALYGIVYFAAFSFLFKRFSIFAKKTPL